jgi:hypothetical protein
MNRDLLLKVVLRLLKDGPQDFGSLARSIELDSSFGFLSLASYGFEAQLRECLKRTDSEGQPYFRQTPDYRWSLSFAALKESPLSSDEIDLNAPWLTFGKGCEIVYSLFLPSVLGRISPQEKIVYPVKIGRTRRRIDNRFNELQTGNFEDLRIGLVIKTDDSIGLERYLHRSLANNRIMRRNNQTEWFLTSLANVKLLSEQYIYSSRAVS